MFGCFRQRLRAERVTIAPDSWHRRDEALIDLADEVIRLDDGHVTP
jgi:hypothetical protein